MVLSCPVPPVRRPPSPSPSPVPCVRVRPGPPKKPRNTSSPRSSLEKPSPVPSSKKQTRPAPSAQAAPSPARANRPRRISSDSLFLRQQTQPIAFALPAPTYSARVVQLILTPRLNRRPLCTIQIRHESRRPFCDDHVSTRPRPPRPARALPAPLLSERQSQA